MLLKWAAIFLIIALIAAAFGFTGVAEGATEIAKVLFYIFLAMCLIFLVAGVVLAERVKSWLGR
jgi:uncharacterized membrane protein YtjA (UPF0391 family)